MSDNELIIQLQTDVLNVVNSSQMPLMVKSIVLENVLLKVNTSVKDEIARQQAQAAAQAEQSKDDTEDTQDTDKKEG
jgi:hypothetical protein